MNTLTSTQQRIYDAFIPVAVKAGWTDAETAEAIRGATILSVREYRRKLGLIKQRGRKSHEQ